MYIRKKDRVSQRECKEHNGDNSLGEYSGHGGAHNAHLGKWTQAEDQDRIQDKIDQKSGSGG